MSRDNVLFIVIGILIGFIAGYLLQEVMASRQPPRLVHGEDGAGGQAAAAPDQPDAQAPGNGGAGQQQAMEARLEEIRNLEGYLASNPEDADAILRLANLSFDVESWSRCVESFEQYLELRPATPDVLSDMGVCYRGVGQLDQALELFDRAHRMEPDHWQSRFNEVVVLAFDQRDFDAAEDVLDELRSLQPDNPAVERLAEEVARRRSAA
ncbi:MAG: tetratricopeptide repeat protein [Thermoanaerobaculia bacterium]